MKQFDLEKLEKAIIYAERMADGRAPYSNQPVENEVLNNPNVIRSMYFIKDVLQAVKANGGIVGGKQSKSAEAAATFPFEVLKQFQYQENMPISHVLKRFVELTGNPDTPIISAINVNKWLAGNGFLTKAVINDDGKENWIPTDKGTALGLLSEKRGEPGREYIRIEYNKAAQEFLAKNLQIITEDCLNTNKSTNRVEKTARQKTEPETETTKEPQEFKKNTEPGNNVLAYEKSESLEKPRSCDNCKSYRIGDCGGINGLCDDYEFAPTTSKEELESWPTDMGPYVTGYGRGRH